MGPPVLSIIGKAANGQNMKVPRRLVAGVFGLSVLALGCAALKNRNESPKSNGHSEAILAAARNRDINMFGEIAGNEEVNYVGRSAVSLRQHSFTDVGADGDPDIDSTGRRTVFSSTRHSVRPDLYIKSIDGVAVTQLTSDPGADVQPAFHPSDQSVAFASDRAGNWDIWIVSVDGGQAVQVTQGLADDVHPSWSPDGTQLVYCSLPPDSGQWELWITDMSAGGNRRFIGYGLFPEWSSSGDTIVYQRARERGGRWFGIWTLTLVDGEPRYPTELAWDSGVAYTLPSWSPDHAWIAFAAVRGPVDSPGNEVATGAASAIWMIAADGRGKVRLTDGVTVNSAPTFAPDGRIYFVSNRTGHDNIWSLPPSSILAGPPQELQTARPAGLYGTQGPVEGAYVRNRPGKDDL